MNIQEKIKDWVKETLKIEEDFALAHPKDLKNGDYSFFSPRHANEFGRTLSENRIPEVEKIEVIGNFINFYLSKNFFANSVKEINKEGDKYGQNNLFKKEKTIVEYTDPNPLKEFHIGHLMSNTIGEAVSRIIEASGAEVKRANYQGDIGIHIACAVWGIKNKGGILKDGSIEEKAKYLGECYAFGATSARDNKNLKPEFQEVNKKIYEKSDKELNEYYKWGRKASLDYFELIYKKLGTKFDFYFFESEVGEEGKKIVIEFLKKGVFEESDSAVVFRGEKRDKKLHTRVFVNSQGLPVYEAKELALAKIKYKKYKYEKSIVVTGNEINEYFKVVMAAMKEVFPDLAVKIKHLSHGMMRLPTGKMSSRTGDVITAEFLIDQVEDKILEKIGDRFEKDPPSHKASDGQGKNEIAEIVAIGAIKYSILRQAIGGDIVFDFDKSISFEGDSGPYLQYTAVRANSVLEKSKAAKTISSADVPDFPSENTASEIILAAPVTDLERYLYRFPEVVERAGKEYAPHHIVTYLTELASMFNSFYATHRIIEDNSPPALSERSELNGSPYKIALTTAVSHILHNGLSLLGIKVPERM